MIRKDNLKGFSGPRALPANPEERRAWQKANNEWWERHPMRYDWKAELQPQEFSRDFYDEIDRRLFQTAAEFLPPRTIPFDGLVDFRALSTAAVLEIGVGSGSHSGLLARHANSFVGIDLTAYAVRSTSGRFRALQIPGAIVRMDAESMGFREHSFDFIWSWGVIHHSSDTERVLQEMRRVLKPGGRAVVMIYHRGFWSYHIRDGILGGLLKGHLLTTRSIHRSVQLQTDGALARYYTPREWRDLASRYFNVERLQTFGPKADFVPLPNGALKRQITRRLPAPLCRFLGTTCRLGGFLVATMVKPASLG